MAAALMSSPTKLPERAKLKGKFQIAIGLFGDHLEGIDAHLLRQALQIRAENGLEDNF